MSISSARSIWSLADVTTSIMVSTSLVFTDDRLANFAFETQKEAEAAHKAMQTVVAKVKVVTAYALA
jgi:hypothetical protein